MNIKIIRIRRSNDKDRCEALKLILKEWEDIKDEDVEDLIISAPGRYRILKYYSALINGKFIGLIGLYAAQEHPKNILFIGWFIVHPHYRGLGIGSKLLRKIEEASREYKVKYLYVVAHENAIKFYIDRGYKQSKSKKLKEFFFHSDCKLLYKPLF